MIDETRLRAEAQQLERLIDELHDLVEPDAWQRIEHVLRVTITLYGTGLAHALEHARTAGANGKLDGLLADDELLASLLVLHGLHPLPTAERVRRAVADLRDRFGVTEGELQLVGVDDGVAHVRVSTNLGGDEMPALIAETAVRHAIEASAPELARIDFVAA